jgi:non-specific serine/threonine protein kinase
MYQRCVKSLKEFGFEPSEQTCALYEKLKARKETFKTEPTIAVKERRKESSKTNLPIPLTTFIGREKEIDQIVKLFGKNRLVTLTGSGGVGKTRLAIQSAKKLIGKFKDGVWWVDLVGLNDPALVSQALAVVLDVREVPNQPMTQTLIEIIQKKQILLVLDNCEHLISGCAQLADRLLSGCQHLKILATSREALDILGETIFSMPSLTLPNTEDALDSASLDKFESIRLFGERAATVKPAFQLNEQNAKSVAQICRRLSGMPLAIELAAARVKMMTVDEIAGRLDDRFDLLTSGNRAALPRHQTLRATIDWSYDLLTDPERTLFRRLSVSAGGFILEAAEAICSDDEIKRNGIVDLLGRLVDKSLVVAEAPSANVATRYRLLETIREYATEKLAQFGEDTQLKDRHLEFYVMMAEKIAPELEHIQQQVWLDRLELEIDNLRAALDWAMASGNLLNAMRLVSALRRFWFIRNHHSEGVDRLKAILGSHEANEPTLARLRVLNTYLFMLWPSDQLAEVRNVGEEAMELGRRLGDRWNTAFALLWLGVGITAQGDYLLARTYLEQSLEIWQDLQDVAYLGWSLVSLGEVALLQNDYQGAQALFEQSIQPLDDEKDFPMLAIPLRRLGQLAMFQGDLPKATALMKRSLQYNWDIRDYRGMGACLAALGALSMAQAKYEHAAELFGLVERVLELIRTSILPFDQQQYMENTKRLRWRKRRACLLSRRSNLRCKKAKTCPAPSPRLVVDFSGGIFCFLRLVLITHKETRAIHAGIHAGGRGICKLWS